MAINPNTEPGGHVRTVHPFNFQVGIEKAILDSNFWACLIVGVYKLYSRVYHTCSVGYVQNIFLFVPSQVLSSPFCSLSLLLIVVTQIRGHIAGPSPPPTHYASCPAFLSREAFSSFFPRRLESNCAYPRYAWETPDPSIYRYMLAWAASRNIAAIVNFRQFTSSVQCYQ